MFTIASWIYVYVYLLNSIIPFGFTRLCLDVEVKEMCLFCTLLLELKTYKGAKSKLNGRKKNNSFQIEFELNVE